MPQRSLCGGPYSVRSTRYGTTTTRGTGTLSSTIQRGPWRSSAHACGGNDGTLPRAGMGFDRREATRITAELGSTVAAKLERVQQLASGSSLAGCAPADVLLLNYVAPYSPQRTAVRHTLFLHPPLWRSAGLIFSSSLQTQSRSSTHILRTHQPRQRSGIPIDCLRSGRREEGLPDFNSMSLPNPM